MPLVEVEVSPAPVEVPEEIRELLREAEARIERFVEARLQDPIVGFVPSDFPAVYGTLRAIAERGLAPGTLFCEWGSGFGVVAMIAAYLEFDACGIEIEGDLVRAAARLAADHGLAVDFVEGSFIPPGGEDVADGTEEFAWLRTDGPNAYDELGLDPDDFDVIFAYPWPGEEHVLAEMFDRYAAAGALLVTYRGVEGVCVRRKQAGRR